MTGKWNERVLPFSRSARKRENRPEKEGTQLSNFGATLMPFWPGSAYRQNRSTLIICLSYKFFNILLVNGTLTTEDIELNFVKIKYDK